MPVNSAIVLSAFRSIFSDDAPPINYPAAEPLPHFQASHFLRAQKAANLFLKLPFKASNFAARSRFAEMIGAKSPNNAGKKLGLDGFHAALPQKERDHSMLSQPPLARLILAASTRKPPAPPLVQFQRSERWMELAIAASRKKPPAPPVIPSSNAIEPKLLARLKLAARSRKIPEIPAPALPVLPKTPQSPRSILKSSNNIPSPVHAVPRLSPEQIFQGILDLKLLSEKEEYEHNGEYYVESDAEYSERIMKMCRALTQAERNELADVVNVVRGTGIYTAKLNPLEKPDVVLDRLKIPNENRKKTNDHNDRLKDHSFSRLKFHTNVGLFRVARGIGKIEPHADDERFEPEVDQVSLQLNLRDRHVSSLETILVNTDTGITKTRRVPRTFYPRDVTDSLSVTNQLSPKKGMVDD